MKINVTAAKKSSSGNRVPTNCTLDPELKGWASKYANARHNESLSSFIERLMREERAREKDRARKAAA